jgi:hypothetical protein
MSASVTDGEVLLVAEILLAVLLEEERVMLEVEDLDVLRALSGVMFEVFRLRLLSVMFEGLEMERDVNAVSHCS